MPTISVVTICHHTTLLQYHWLYSSMLCLLFLWLIHSKTVNLYLPLPFNNLPHPPSPLPSGNHQFFLCTYRFDSAFCLFIHFLKDLFILERERAEGGAEGEGQEEGEKQKQTPHWAWSPMQARSHDPEIMTWAEIKSQMLNGLSHPGAMVFCFVFF